MNGLPCIICHIFECNILQELIVFAATFKIIEFSGSEMKAELTFLDVLRFAAGYWRRQKGRLCFVISAFVVAGLLDAYLPTLLAQFLSNIRQQMGKDVIVFSLSVFLGVFFLKTLIFTSNFLIYNSFETKLFKMLVDDVFKHLYRLPERYFANTFTGSIVSKISRARTKIETFEDVIIIRFLPSLVVVSGSTVFLFFKFPVLAILLVFYFVLFTIVSVFLFLKVAGKKQTDYAQAQDHFVAHLADGIGGISTTKSFARDKQEVNRMLDITALLRRTNLKAYRSMNISGTIQRHLLFGMLALLLGGGVWYLLVGKANVEDMAYLILAYTILQNYLNELGDNLKNVMTASYDLHAVINLMHENPEVESELPPLSIRQGGIVFENVTFTYPGKSRPVFENLNVNIKPGERVALVGHSGSGKTTLIRLLQCLYQPQAGTILVDGQNIATGSRISLREAMATVPQDPILFHRTLGENIGYAKDAAPMAEIRHAAEKAHIADFIEGLPLKYNTLVGERGIKLSGGERQRIAIARAILADRPILILDEATSSLDSGSEKAIQEALYALTHGRTSIMIAHRLSTILDADRILVFDKGRIVEEGTHAELVSRENGIYANLYKLQSGGFIVE